jgi:hypothetical protein
MKLGERFIQQGLLTPARLEAALKAQLIFGGHLGTVLLELGHVDEHALGNTLAKIYDVHYAPPHFFHEIPKATIDLLPKRLAEKLHAVPFDKHDRTLDVAMIDPKDLRALDEIAFATGCRIVPWVSPEARIFQVLERYYDIPRRHRYISVCQTLDAASSAMTPSERERRESAVLGSAFAPPPYLAALSPTSSETDGASMEGPPAAPSIGQAPAVVATAGTSGSPSDVPASMEAWRAAPAEAAASTPAAIPAVRTLSDLAEALCRSEHAGDLSAASLEFLSARLKRTLLFLVRGATATLWCAGGLESRAPLPSMILPITSEPLFSLLHERDHYRGPMPNDNRYWRLFESLGIATPTELVLLPGYLDDRLLVVVYGDAGPLTPLTADIAELQQMVGKVAAALHLVALKRKIRAQEPPVPAKLEDRKAA